MPRSLIARALAVLFSAGVVAGCQVGTGADSGADLASPDLTSCQAHPDEGSCAPVSGCRLDGDCLSNPALPRCDSATGTCFECLPTHDNCLAGKVCTAIGKSFACRTQCQTDADCLRLGGASSCCAGTCHDLMTDLMSCGACGHACGMPPNGVGSCTAGKCTIDSCHDGLWDCDKLYATGCESDPLSDPRSCGGCGKMCLAIANSVGCDKGVCDAACKPGYSDCNKDPKDGCEADLTFDILNCGACGTVVPPTPNAVPSCDNGKPSFRCTGHFFDCDGDPKNGCERDTTADLMNCGHCGNSCATFANSAPACVAAQCALICNKNFGDCDHLLQSGCETSLLADPNHCGSCAQGCRPINATATCAAGACHLACNMGWLDCNADGSDGCEANPLVDSGNCNGCGHVCPKNAPACVAGACVAGCLAGMTPPPACATGADPQTGASYVVCSADCNGAWIAADKGGGQYHALQICRGYGYGNLGSFGGTCGAVCGHCGPGSCAKNGSKVFDGTGNTCGTDKLGPILCFAVHWSCLP